MATYKIYRLVINDKETPCKWLKSFNREVSEYYGFDREYENINDVPGGFTPLLDALDIYIQNSQNRGTRIYTFFTTDFKAHPVRFLLTEGPAIPPLAIYAGRIENEYGYITISNEHQANPIFTTTDNTKISLNPKGMHISRAGAPVANLDEVFDDEEAQAAIHLYILALAYSAKLTGLDQETIRALEEEKFPKISRILNEIVNFKPDIPLNPTSQNARKIRKLWEAIIIHTDLQNTYDRVKERILMLTKSIESRSNSKEAERLFFPFIAILIAFFGLFTQSGIGQLALAVIALLFILWAALVFLLLTKDTPPKAVEWLFALLPPLFLAMPAACGIASSIFKHFTGNPLHLCSFFEAAFQ